MEKKNLHKVYPSFCLFCSFFLISLFSSSVQHFDLDWTALPRQCPIQLNPFFQTGPFRSFLVACVSLGFDVQGPFSGSFWGILGLRFEVCLLLYVFCDFPEFWAIKFRFIYCIEYHLFNFIYLIWKALFRFWLRCWPKIAKVVLLLYRFWSLMQFAKLGSMVNICFSEVVHCKLLTCWCCWKCLWKSLRWILEVTMH